MSNNQLPTYLKEQLARRNWSGRTLAMYAGVSHSTVARAVRGTHIPDPENLHKIAIALEVTTLNLLRLAGYVTSPAASECHPSASYIAQRLSQLPKGVRESAIETVGAVVDNIYTVIEIKAAAAKKAQQAKQEQEEEADEEAES